MEPVDAGAAIFLPNGAVRIRTDGELWDKLQELVALAEEKGRVEGTAVMQNNVYVQQFEEEKADTEDKVGMLPTSTKYVLPVGSMYAGRVPLSSAEEVIAMLSAAGLTEKALLDGISDRGDGSGSLKGLPKGVTSEAVKHFFATRGKDAYQLAADMTTVPLREPLDYVSDRGACEPGEILVVDNIDPSFSRLPTQVSSATEGEQRKLMPVKSIGGYRDAVFGMDQATGFGDIVGRIRKKHPHLVLKRFIDKWQGIWASLKKVKMDDEFITEETILIKEQLGLQYEQSVPGMHSRVIGQVEGTHRWLQDVAQGHMNRVEPLVKSGKLPEKVAKSLWFHALTLALYASWFKESLRQNGKTRFEEGFDQAPNLSRIVMLPFVTRIIARKLGNDPEGRGQEAIYLGPSLLVPGGIVTMSLKTFRISVKYSFKPREKMPELDDVSLFHSIKVFYGDLYKIEGPPGVEVLNDAGVSTSRPSIVTDSLARATGSSSSRAAEVSQDVREVSGEPSVEESSLAQGVGSTAVNSGERSVLRRCRGMPSSLEALVVKVYDLTRSSSFPFKRTLS